MEIKMNEKLCMLHIMDKAMGSCPHVRTDYKRCSCGHSLQYGHTCRIYNKKLKKANNGYCYRCSLCLIQDKPKDKKEG